MFGFLRNAAVIGVMAYFSPVHDMSAEQRLDALRAAPGQVMSEALKAGPGLALKAAASLDAASREALSAKIADMALRTDQPTKMPGSR